MKDSNREGKDSEPSGPEGLEYAWEVTEEREPQAPNQYRVFRRSDPSYEATVCELWSGEQDNAAVAKAICDALNGAQKAERSEAPEPSEAEGSQSPPRHDLLSELHLRGAVKSFGEARRLIEQGAVSVNGEKATKANLSDPYSYDLSAIRVGKRDFPVLNTSPPGATPEAVDRIAGGLDLEGAKRFVAERNWVPKVYFLSMVEEITTLRWKVESLEADKRELDPWKTACLEIGEIVGPTDWATIVDLVALVRARLRSQEGVRERLEKLSEVDCSGFQVPNGQEDAHFYGYTEGRKKLALEILEAMKNG